MTREEYQNLGITEKLDFLADKLIFEKQSAGGINEAFTREPVQPTQPQIDTPAGFETIFGAEPEKINSAQRAVWLNQLRNYGGLIPDFYKQPDYPDKNNKSDAAGLGYPIGYIFNGELRITFSKKPAFWRPIEWYNNYYDILVDVARNSR